MQVSRRQGRLFICEPSPGSPIWSQTSGSGSIHQINSISDAAKVLRIMGARWACASQEFHRRSALIQDRLPRFKTKPLSFLADLPAEPWGAWALLDEHTLFAAPRTSSTFPLGKVEFAEDPSPPSRAYLKLWEAFTVHGLRPRPGERVVDLGSAPGGWTWVLAELGCRVLSVDRADLDPRLHRPEVEHRKQDAFKLDPSQVGPVDWLFSDLICYPDRLFSLVDQWRSAGVRRMVCTIKFQGETDFSAITRFLEWPGARVIHLCANKHELTWIWLGPAE